MADQPFDAKIRKIGEAVVIDLFGDIDAFADQSLDEAYLKATSTGAQSVLLNFTRVHYINSTGIALIVRILAQARKSGISLLAYGLSDHYQEIFEITRLSDFLTIFPDEPSALASLATAQYNESQRR